MGDQIINLPVGFRFRPTEQELLYFLELKVRGYQIPPPIPNMLVERTLYGKDATPWDVLNDNDLWELCDDNGNKVTRRAIYVLTKLSKISAKKISRTAGCGTWDGQTKGKPIWDYEGEKIKGSVKFLSYVLDFGCESKAKGKGHWNMHEYSLDGDSLIGIGRTDWVICRITRDDTKESKLGKVKSKKLNTEEKDKLVQEVRGSINLESPQSNQGNELRIEGNQPMIVVDHNVYCNQYVEQEPNGLEGNQPMIVVDHSVYCNQYVEQEPNSYSALATTAPVEMDCHDQQVLIGTCLGVEDGCTMVADKEENVQFTSEGMDYWGANGSTGEGMDYWGTNGSTGEGMDYWGTNGSTVAVVDQELNNHPMIVVDHNVYCNQYVQEEPNSYSSLATAPVDIDYGDQQVVIGTCLGVEDGCAMVTDKEENVQFTSEGMDYWGTNGSTVAAVDQELNNHPLIVDHNVYCNQYEEEESNSNSALATAPVEMDCGAQSVVIGACQEVQDSCTMVTDKEENVKFTSEGMDYWGTNGSTVAAVDDQDFNNHHNVEPWKADVLIPPDFQALPLQDLDNYSRRNNPFWNEYCLFRIGQALHAC